MVLPRRVPHVRVHDRVVDRITKAGRKHGAFVGTEYRDAVDQHAGPAEGRERAGLLGQIGVEGHPLAAVQLKQRVGRDLDELVVRNGVADDDQRAFLSLHLQPGPRVVLTLNRHPGHVHEGVGRTAGVIGTHRQYQRRHQVQALFILGRAPRSMEEVTERIPELFP